jgi:hypothetical protein
VPAWAVEPEGEAVVSSRAESQEAASHPFAILGEATVHTIRWKPLILAVAAAMLAIPTSYSAPPRTGATARVYLPFVARQPTPAPICPLTSTRQYASGPADQYDRDNPVRPAYDHADKNLALRSYTPNTDPDLKRSLVSYGTDDPTLPPQLATLFSPSRVPALVGFYRVYDWHWADSPNRGTRGAPLTTYRVTALGLQTTPGEVLHVPVSGYTIGGDPLMEAMVIYADEDTIALHYTREDTAALGYTVHLDKICTDPNLLALYNQLDAPAGPRYVYVPPERRPYRYNLPTLYEGQVFGTARGTEIVVAIVDTGNYMDPRSCNEWWQIRPGYTGACPRPE